MIRAEGLRLRYGRRVGIDGIDFTLYPWMNVASARGVGGRVRGHALAECFGLESDVSVPAMSRGMRHKLGLVLALAHDPDLLGSYLLQFLFVLWEPARSMALWRTWRRIPARGNSRRSDVRHGPPLFPVLRAPFAEPCSMQIRDWMQTSPVTCQPWDRLSLATQSMWSADLGWLPVVDDHERLVGVLTDRDACMHAATTGLALSDLLVKGCMQSDVASCAPTDSLDVALARLAERQVHRLAVVRGDGRLSGVLTLGDVARAWRAEKGVRKRKQLAEKAWQTVAAVLRPQGAAPTTIEPMPPKRAISKRPSASGARKASASRKAAKPKAPKGKSPAGGA